MVASNHCQYPIPEAMIPKVKERCGEWVENQWVVLLPAGERNNWSSPLLAVNKFLQEKLDKVWPAMAEERKEILASTHAKSHMGENMLFNMIWEDGYWWETLWKECKKLTCSCKECMFFNIGRKGFHPVSTI